jgi:CheY-like chemotaxis protein
VLLVDDEEIVREVGSTMLLRMGFEVLTARDGLEALDILRERAKEIAILVLDLKMPRMDGMTALPEVRKIRGDLPVLLSSGYTREYALDHLAADGVAGFIQKPFLYSNLKEKLKAALGTTVVPFAVSPGTHGS